MYKLLSINGVPLPNPMGDFTISQNDKYNEYEGEDGKTTVEIIRQGILSLSVSFNGLPEDYLKMIVDAIRIVSTVVIYNPLTKSTRKMTAKITGVKSKKIWYQNNQSLWSLSFEIDEL